MTWKSITAAALTICFVLTGCQEWNAQWEKQMAQHRARWNKKPTDKPEKQPEKTQPVEKEEVATSEPTEKSDGSTAKAVQDYLNNLKLAADGAKQSTPEKVEQAPTEKPQVDRYEQAKNLKIAKATPPAEFPKENENSTGEEKTEPVAQDPAKQSSGANVPVNLAALEVPEESTPKNTPELPKVIAVALTGDHTLEAPAVAEKTLGIQEGLEITSPGGKVSLKQLIEQARLNLEEEPASAKKQWQLTLLRLAAGQQQSAVDVSPSLAEDSRTLINNSVKSMEAISYLLNDPLADADEALRAVENLRQILQKGAALQIPTIALCTKVVRFGLYDAMPADYLRPYQANRIILYCEIKNFTSDSENNERYHTLLTARFELFTSDGRSLWEHEEKKLEDYSRKPREDFFLSQIITLPPGMPPGDYVLKVTITDLLGDKTNEGNHRFSIPGGLSVDTLSRGS